MESGQARSADGSLCVLIENGASWRSVIFQDKAHGVWEVRGDRAGSLASRRTAQRAYGLEHGLIEHGSSGVNDRGVSDRTVLADQEAGRHLALEAAAARLCGVAHRGLRTDSAMHRGRSGRRPSDRTAGSGVPAAAAGTREGDGASSGGRASWTRF